MPRSCLSSAASRQKSAPRAVASSRPSEPPIVNGLPVTTPSTECPLFIENVSNIHAIVAAFVPTSGAGMSFSGPISLMISEVNRRVMRSSSPRDIVFGSHTTPPFAPPNGRPISAHFHVIHIASAFTSSSVTSGW